MGKPAAPNVAHAPNLFFQTFLPAADMFFNFIDGGNGKMATTFFLIAACGSLEWIFVNQLSLNVYLEVYLQNVFKHMYQILAKKLHNYANQNMIQCRREGARDLGV